MQLRDREAQYNKKTLAKLAALTPNVYWNLYLKTIDAGNLDDVIVGQPEFFQAVNEMLDTVPLDDWRTYLRWHLVHSKAPYLSSAFEDEDFHFYSEVLRGIKQMQPRWKRAVRHRRRQMGEALGRLYVEKYFTPAAKERMDELVKNLMAAYRERIAVARLDGRRRRRSRLWPSSATVMPKIGYPDKVARLLGPGDPARFVRART